MTDVSLARLRAWTSEVDLVGLPRRKQRLRDPDGGIIGFVDGTLAPPTLTLWSGEDRLHTLLRFEEAEPPTRVGPFGVHKTGDWNVLDGDGRTLGGVDCSGAKSTWGSGPSSFTWPIFDSERSPIGTASRGFDVKDLVPVVSDLQDVVTEIRLGTELVARCTVENGLKDLVVGRGRLPTDVELLSQHLDGDRLWLVLAAAILVGR
jgi:hypothetical protein